MNTKHCCGPDHDREFFEAVDELFNRFPDMAGKYSITCMDHETDIMKVDFRKKVGVARIEGGRVITEFHDRSENEKYWTEKCCEWAWGDPDRYGRRRKYCARAWAYDEGTPEGRVD